MKTFVLLSRFVVAILCGAFAGKLYAADAAHPQHGYTVTVDIKIDEKGTPESTKVFKSEDVSPDKVLDQMALVMALKATFPPQLKDGKPAKATVRAPFFFPIDNDEGPAADLLPKPGVKDAVQPAYPLALRDQGVVGGVIFELFVDAEGKLTKLTTLRASHPEFEAAARASMEKWVFTPARRDGVPVESRTRFAYIFDTIQDKADLKWRIPPRPRLASMIITRPDHPIQDEPEPAAASATAPTVAPTEPTK